MQGGVARDFVNFDSRVSKMRQYPKIHFLGPKMIKWEPILSNCPQVPLPSYMVTKTVVLDTKEKFQIN